MYEKSHQNKMFEERVLNIAIFLIGSFFGAVLAHFVWPGLMKAIDVKLFGTAEVVVNINELQMLQKTQHLEDFSVLFGTSNNAGWIAAVKVGHKDLNKLFGEILVPDDFGEFGNLEYNVTITNTGKRIAKNINLSFEGEGLKTDRERDISKNVDFINCGGFGAEHSCETKIKKLSKGERTGFFARAESSSARNIRCSMDSVGSCWVNYRNFYVKKVTQGERLDIRLDESSIQSIPPINESSIPVLFRYKTQTDKWLPIDKKSLQFLIAKEGLSFDISAIPDGASIDNYIIDRSDSLGPKVIVEHSE